MCGSLETAIKESVTELGTLLAKVKGSGAVSLNQPSQKADTQQQADMILRPVMEFLEYLMHTFADVRMLSKQNLSCAISIVLLKFAPEL